jgi:ferric-dicitrate binding protein FerR (iron transport regulator)
MNRQAFQELLRRYLQGDCSPDETHLIDQWYARLVQDPGLSLTAHEKKAMEEELWQSIHAQIQEPEVIATPGISRQPVFFRKWPVAAWYSGIAALLVLAVALTWLVYQKPPAEKAIPPVAVFEKGAALVFHENKTTHAQKIMLEDKSEIILTPGSSLYYPSRFASRREVQLTGDAFFNVARNPHKPFFVYSSNLVTQVLGTSFWVKSRRKDKSIQVEVKTGQVSVYEQIAAKGGKAAHAVPETSKGVVLKPNQKAVYFTENRHWETSLVEQPAVVPAPAAAPAFIYQDTALAEVIRDLEKGFGIEIIMANVQLKACTFTGDLAQLTLYEKLDLVCKSIKASYQIRGTHIVINGKGCE